MESQGSTLAMDIGKEIGEKWTVVPKKSLGRCRHPRQHGASQNGSAEPGKKPTPCFTVLADDEEDCLEDEQETSEVSLPEEHHRPPAAPAGGCSELADSRHTGKPQARKKMQNGKQPVAKAEDFDTVLAEEKELTEEQETQSLQTIAEAVQSNVTSSQQLKRRTKAMAEDDATPAWSLVAMVLASATNLMVDTPVDGMQSTARTDRAAMKASAASEQEKMRSRCHAGVSKSHGTAPRQQRRAVGRRG